MVLTKSCRSVTSRNWKSTFYLFIHLWYNTRAVSVWEHKIQTETDIMKMAHPQSWILHTNMWESSPGSGWQNRLEVMCLLSILAGHFLFNFIGQSLVNSAFLFTSASIPRTNSAPLSVACHAVYRVHYTMPCLKKPCTDGVGAYLSIFSMTSVCYLLSNSRTITRPPSDRQLLGGNLQFSTQCTHGCIPCS